MWCNSWLALPVLIIAQDTDTVAAILVLPPDQIFHCALELLKNSVCMNTFEHC